MKKSNTSYILAVIFLVIVFLVFVLPKMAEKPPAIPPIDSIKSNLDYQHGQPIRVVLPDLINPTHRMMQAGFLAACHDLGLWCETVSGNSDTLEAYIGQIELPISLGSSGVVVNLGAPVLYQAGIKLAGAGFPVVDAHSIISTKDIPGLTGWVSADAVKYSKDAAAEMAKLIDCKGKVAVMQNGASDTENAVGQGFSAELLRLCPSVIVLGVQLETGDPVKGSAVDAASIAANPDLTGAFSTTGGGPTSWSLALKQAGKAPGEIKVIGVDTTLQNLDTLKAGWVQALVAQPVYDEFYKGVELVLAKLKGEPVSYENLLDAPIVRPADLDKYYKMLKDAGIGQ